MEIELDLYDDLDLDHSLDIEQVASLLFIYALTLASPESDLTLTLICRYRTTTWTVSVPLL